MKDKNISPLVKFVTYSFWCPLWADKDLEWSLVI